MKIILRKIFILIFGVIVRNRWRSMIAFFYSLIIKELLPEGKMKRPSRQAKNNKLTILALSIVEFRGDIECIVNTNEFRVLVIPDQWQRRLAHQFYPVMRQKYLLRNNPGLNDYKYKNEQKEIRAFLYEFLERLYKRISINCVISPHSRFVVDLDWGAVSTKMGIPHIMLPRDSQFASTHALLNRMMNIYKNALPKYEGEHIIIQSELDKQVYTGSGYAKPEQVSSLGCPRMDNFVKRIMKNENKSANRRKKVVFLPYRIDISGTGLYKAMKIMQDMMTDVYLHIREVHLFFVHFALQYPEIDVVIKPKPKQPRVLQETGLLELLKDSSIEIEEIPNLTIKRGLDLHDLFFEADVVCGLQTSAILEAAIIRPVIIPYFKDLQNPKYDELLFYRDYYNLFNIAKDKEELESLILKRLDSSTIEKEVMDSRIALFEKYISSFEGNATEKYIECIKQVISQCK